MQRVSSEVVKATILLVGEKEIEVNSKDETELDHFSKSKTDIMPAKPERIR